MVARGAARTRRHDGWPSGHWWAQPVRRAVVAAFSLLPAATAVVAGAIVLVVAGMFKTIRGVGRILVAHASAERHRARAIVVLEVAYHVLGIAEAYITLGLINPLSPSLEAA